MAYIVIQPSDFCEECILALRTCAQSTLRPSKPPGTYSQVILRLSLQVKPVILTAVGDHTEQSRECRVHGQKDFSAIIVGGFHPSKWQRTTFHDISEGNQQDINDMMLRYVEVQYFMPIFYRGWIHKYIFLVAHAQHYCGICKSCDTIGKDRGVQTLFGHFLFTFEFQRVKSEKWNSIFSNLDRVKVIMHKRFSKLRGTYLVFFGFRSLCRYKIGITTHKRCIYLLLYQL